jgi:hypothetical protein
VPVGSKRKPYQTVLFVDPLPRKGALSRCTALAGRVRVGPRFTRMCELRNSHSGGAAGRKRNIERAKLDREKSERFKSQVKPVDNVLAILLAGGAGERLYPLTRATAKPAVPFGDAYRIIDFTLSNCINSDIRRIFVLAQYKSLELIRHVRDGWSILSPELGEYIEIISAMKPTGEGWYLGTADAVFQNTTAFSPKMPTWC